MANNAAMKKREDFYSYGSVLDIVGNLHSAYNGAGEPDFAQDFADIEWLEHRIAHWSPSIDATREFDQYVKMLIMIAIVEYRSRWGVIAAEYTEKRYDLYQIQLESLRGVFYTLEVAADYDDVVELGEAYVAETFNEYGPFRVRALEHLGTSSESGVEWLYKTGEPGRKDAGGLELDCVCENLAVKWTREG